MISKIEKCLSCRYLSKENLFINMFVSLFVCFLILISATPILAFTFSEWASLDFLVSSFEDGLVNRLV